MKHICADNQSRTTRVSTDFVCAQGQNLKEKKMKEMMNDWVDFKSRHLKQHLIPLSVLFLDVASGRRTLAPTYGIIT